MSAEHRDNYRKPTPAEARHFAEVNRAWLKWRRRKRIRYVVQLVAAIALVVAIAAALLVALWAIIAGLVFSLDGIA